MAQNKIYITKEFSFLDQGTEALGGVPVKVEKINSITIETIDLLSSNRTVFVGDLNEFSVALKTSKKKPEDLKAKCLLLHSGKKLDVSFGTIRGFDVISNNSTDDLVALGIQKLIAEFDFDEEVASLREGDQKNRRDLDTLNEIGSALSEEKDLEKLLDLIITKTREMTWADAGTLYLLESDPDVEENPDDYFANKKMRFQASQNDSKDIPFKTFVMDISKKTIYGYVALTHESLVFPDVYNLDPTMEYSWGGRDFDSAINYRTMSMLTVPMVNWRGETIGVIQLINRKTDPNIILDNPEEAPQFIRSFTEHDTRIAWSIASQASIAIQNAQLVNSIKGLFDGFIAASVKAIESRDPTTSGHSQRVATLTVELAKLVDRSDEQKFIKEKFTEERLQEIRYASLLHDFGKIGVRENVLVKAKKLFPHELQGVKDRFDLIRRTIEFEFSRREVEALQKGAPENEIKELLATIDAERVDRLQQLDDYTNFIFQCNEPTVLAQGGFDMLKDIAVLSFENWDGSVIPYLNEKELISLSVPKGSLNDNDRKEIESHVTHTYKFLTTIPWTPDLRHVPEIAYAHHEKLDGTGYPNQLNAKTIPIQSKMMTISDIYDALTAMDRPYKKALPAERALNILKEEANASHVDPDLLDMFIESEIYKIVLHDQ